MKLAIVGSLQAPMTGSKIRGRGLARHLSRLGHEVVYLEPTDSRSDEAVDVGDARLIRTSYPLSNVGGMAWAGGDNLRQLLRQSQLDFVLSLKPLPSSCMPAIARRSFSRKRPRIIVDVDDLEYAYWEHSPRLAAAVKRYERWTIRRFDLVTIHCEPLRDYVTTELGVDESRVLSLPQGLDISKYDAAQPLRDPRLVGRRLLVYSGFLGVATDLVPMFEACRGVCQSDPSLLLVVVGGGPRLAEYQAAAKRLGLDALFVGYVDHPTALSYIKSADLALNYMNASAANAYRSSIKIREYLALGRPVVATDVADGHLFSGLIYLAQPNPTDFEQTLLEALSADTPLTGGQELVRQNYAWEQIASRFSESLEALL